jgi:tetratricopeptide (TPR) repeat protein
VTLCQSQAIWDKSGAQNQINTASTVIVSRCEPIAPADHVTTSHTTGNTVHAWATQSISRQPGHRGHRGRPATCRYSGQLITYISVAEQIDDGLCAERRIHIYNATPKSLRQRVGEVNRGLTVRIEPGLVLALLASVLCSATVAAQPVPQASQLTREGRTLSGAQANDLEARLTTNPEDLAVRTRLLGYYFASALRVMGAEVTRAARRRHIIWMIEHHPEADVMTLSEMTIDPAGHPLADPDGYAEAKTRWLAQIDRRKDDPRVLLHAARFFRLPDRALALDLLKQAVRLSPTDANAAGELGYVYAITILGVTMINNNGLPMAADPAAATSALATQAIADVRTSSNFAVIRSAGAILAQYGVIVGAISKVAINQDALAEELLTKAEAMNPTDFGAVQSLAAFYHFRWIGAQTAADRTKFATQELEQAERAVERSKADPDWYRGSLLMAAKAALEANDINKARQFATTALVQVGSRNDGTTGQTVHDSHVVLGRVALRTGNLAEAKVHLQQAGQVTGGGTLTSFGPNMSLAKELLERGERESVVRYLDACGAFWPNRLRTQWIQTITSGGTPNFGANLTY